MNASKVAQSNILIYILFMTVTVYASNKPYFTYNQGFDSSKMVQVQSVSDSLIHDLERSFEDARIKNEISGQRISIVREETEQLRMNEGLADRASPFSGSLAVALLGGVKLTDNTTFYIRSGIRYKIDANTFITLKPVHGRGIGPVYSKRF